MNNDIYEYYVMGSMYEVVVGTANAVLSSKTMLIPLS